MSKKGEERVAHHRFILKRDIKMCMTAHPAGKAPTLSSDSSIRREGPTMRLKVMGSNLVHKQPYSVVCRDRACGRARLEPSNDPRVNSRFAL
jgi:hypothetical protein